MNLRGLIDSWSKDFDGLQDSSDGMICTYCKKFPNIAGPSGFISGNKSYRIDGIRSHYSLNKNRLPVINFNYFCSSSFNVWIKTIIEFQICWFELIISMTIIITYGNYEYEYFNYIAKWCTNTMPTL